MIARWRLWRDRISGRSGRPTGSAERRGHRHHLASSALAVVIDADNTSPKVVPTILSEVQSLGVACVKRVYGDWTRPDLASWKPLLHRHAIRPIQQFRYTTGKNSSDAAMIIDAMDLLHSHRFDGFCIVSSDSDFTRLACRIREEGLLVYGFGARSTPEAFARACDRFFPTDAFEAGPATPGPAPRTTAPSSSVSFLELAEALLDVYNELEPGGGWVSLTRYGGRLYQRVPDLRSRMGGSPRLSRFLSSTGLFDIELRTGPRDSHPSQCYLRRRGETMRDQAAPGSSEPATATSSSSPESSPNDRSLRAGREPRQPGPSVTSIPPREAAVSEDPGSP